MLGEAHRRLERGTDLVAAVVETHGRKKTAELLDGMTSSRRATSTTAAAISRTRRTGQYWPGGLRSSSSTNWPTPTPGQQNPKRWMDVEELLRRRHLGDLHRQRAAPREPQRRRRASPASNSRETVPDEIVRQASQIELVDITPKRCGAGFPTATSTPPRRSTRRCRTTSAAATHRAAGAGAAVARRPGRRRPGEAPGRQQDHRHLGGPRTGRRRRHRRARVRKRLVRRASRIASKSSAELMIVHVVRGDGPPGFPPHRWARSAELAASLGATVHRRR